MKLTNIEDIKNYLLGGHAEFTLKSKHTGAHHTYKTNLMPKREDAFFVSHLTGSDNESDFRYLGLITTDLKLIHTNASPSIRSNGFMALNWFLNRLDRFESISDQVEFYHTGKCSACGRKLTTPESIERGMGPVCRERLG